MAVKLHSVCPCICPSSCPGLCIPVLGFIFMTFALTSKTVSNLPESDSGHCDFSWHMTGFLGVLCCFLPWKNRDREQA